jgi:radical SAM protein with 4Fe4S-binding SPASM domain
MSGALAANVPPSYIGIEVTRRCNLRCPHCFTASGAQAHPGPTAAVLGDLIARAVSAGVRVVAFSGGEPLLRDDLEDVMLAGLQTGVREYRLVTNGALVTRVRARSLRTAGLAVAMVSVDGVDAADHAAVRGCSTIEFYRAVRAVRLLREAGVVVDIATVVNRRNVERVAEIALLAESLGARGLRWCSFVPTGRGSEPAVRERFAVPSGQLDAFLAFLRELNAHERRPVEIFFDHGIGPWDEQGRFACTSGAEVAYVTAEGDIYPCPGLVFPPFRVGNVGETPLEDLLRAPAMATVRHLPKGELSGLCRDCTHAACSGGCRGQAWAETGDIRTGTGYCNVRRRT